MSGKPEETSSPATKKIMAAQPINQLPTHLPDIVVFVDHAKKMPFQIQLQGVLMFLDISGFTNLCEKYAENSKNGTDQLTKTLNSYMEALVSEMLNHDGDILKFAGDAILALWQVEGFDNMKTTIHHVLSCAMSIQEKYGMWHTQGDVVESVLLRVKIGISIGEVNMTFVGHDEFRHYVTVGRAVSDANLAEKFCTSGDVVISPSGWCHCYGLNIEHEILHDKQHVKIIGIEDLPGVVFRTVNTIDVAMIGTNSVPPPASADAKTKYKAKDELENEVTEKVRIAVLNAPEPNQEKAMLYIAPPVLAKIKKKASLDYLSEMRQVSIVFINLSIRDCTTVVTALALQSAFEIIYRNAKQTQGCLNKIFAFDKGSTFMVIFGLPGFKEGNDCSNALRCSYEMQVELSNNTLIDRCSIGVTTGSTFCGVVGHNQRHEYTVIGRKVNMAARLMMHYPGQVTCDNDTFHHSRLSKNYFHIVETKEMKGLANIGTIREYRPSAESSEMDENELEQEMCPILGRDDELELCTDLFEKLRKDDYAGRCQKYIVFSGETGIGRSKLLDEIYLLASKVNIRVISCSLTRNDLENPLYAMTTMLMDLLVFSGEMTFEEKQNAFLEMFQNDSFIMQHASVLNDFLHMQIETTHVESKIPKQTILIEVISKIISECTKRCGFIIFMIDDVHFMDLYSWEIIHVLGLPKQSLLIMTHRAPFTVPKKAQLLQNEELVLCIKLRGLAPEYLAALACQLLDVCSIPLEIDSLLQEKSHGVPSWCGHLLRELHHDGFIQIVENDPSYAVNMITPPSNYLTRSVRKAEDSVINQKKNNDEELVSKICILDPKFMDKKTERVLPESIKDIIQGRIDHMEDFHQEIVKSASILGVSFPRPLLENILSLEGATDGLDDAIQQLADAGIFVCAYPVLNIKKGIKSNTNFKEAILKNIMCRCPSADGSVVEKPMGKCQFLQFFATSVQETTYEMYLENTRQKLHLQVAQFLESQSHKCPACGGGNLLQTLMLKQNDMENNALEGYGPRNKESAAAIGMSVSTRGLDTGLSIKNTVSSFYGDLSDKEIDEQKKKKRWCIVRNFIRKSLEHSQTTFHPMPAHLAQLKRPGIALVKKLSRTEESNRRISLSGKTIAPRNTDVSSKSSPRGTPKDQNQEVDIVDLRECYCVRVLMSVYPMLVRHWKASGNIAKTLHYLMEASAAALSVHSNTKALSYLKIAGDIIDKVKEKKNPFDGELVNLQQYEWSKWETARLNSLQGQGLFNSGKIDESMRHFERALDTLGSPQPNSVAGILLTNSKNTFTHWKYSYFSNKYIGRGSERPYCAIEKARCFSHLLHWCLTNRHDKRAYTMTIQQVNIMESTNCDLHELIMGYMCMMECCHLFSHRKLGEIYEYKAQTRCLAAIDQVGADDLQTIAHFFMTSLRLRLSWGKIEEAIDTGYIAYKLSRKIHDNDLKQHLLPVLIMALIMSNRIPGAVDALKELAHTQEETSNIMAKAVYNSLCVDIIFETGFQLEPYSNCGSEDMYISCQNFSCHCPNTKFYILAKTALWHARRHEWDEAEESYQNLPIVIWNNFDSVLAARGLAMILEFKLIHLSHSMAFSGLNIDIIKNLETLIKADFADFSVICKTMPVFLPRYMHMRAYMNAIHGHSSLAKKCLKKATAKANEVDWALEVKWIEHNHLMWYSTAEVQLDKYVWLNHAKEEMLDWHSAKDTKESMLYALPLPNWFHTN